jgi:hypothetical protein
LPDARSRRLEALRLELRELHRRIKAAATDTERVGLLARFAALHPVVLALADELSAC